MKAGKYSIKDFFVNRHIYQIIIPEIQRDYVWGKDQILSLLNSIQDEFTNYKHLEIPIKWPSNKALEEAIHDFVRKRNASSNIGFIYAYNDEQYPGKYFLIDGQQRITSLYLILLAIASQDELLKEKFRRTYIHEEVILKLDYKVREAAHNFFFSFVPFVLNSREDVKLQRWYHNDFNNDPSIRNIVNNFSTILEHIQQQQLDIIAFYQYVEDFTEFWYFDTNVSEQGEELYIYMNARGEQMQNNENIKADLLSRYQNKAEKDHYGHLWEEWQDYFWVHSGTNENAYKCFNDFLY
jgi:uncharacterized protein with ParB-like and HNH nuclease domain